MGHLLRSVCALAFATLAVRADDVTFTNSGSRASLIELYTSEGCSSCPPAEAWMNGLKDSPRLWKEVFPVNFHVDYWDGLGWKDRFAENPFTQRQYVLAKRLGQDSVYTPEFVVDAKESRAFFHGTEPDLGADKRGELTVTINGDAIRSRFIPSSGSAAGLTWNVALLGLNLQSDVQGGENGGKQLRHDFVVLAFHDGPLLSKGEVLHMKSTTADKPAALVSWISAKDGTIVQVTGGWLAR